MNVIADQLQHIRAAIASFAKIVVALQCLVVHLDRFPQLHSLLMVEIIIRPEFRVVLPDGHLDSLPEVDQVFLV